MFVLGVRAENSGDLDDALKFHFLSQTCCAAPNPLVVDFGRLDIAIIPECFGAAPLDEGSTWANGQKSWPPLGSAQERAFLLSAYGQFSLASKWKAGTGDSGCCRLPRVSTLRALDVILWMKGKADEG